MKFRTTSRVKKISIFQSIKNYEQFFKNHHRARRRNIRKKCWLNKNKTNKFTTNEKNVWMMMSEQEEFFNRVIILPKKEEEKNIWRGMRIFCVLIYLQPILNPTLLLTNASFNKILLSFFLLRRSKLFFFYLAKIH